MADEPTSVSIGKCVVTDSFDPQYKTTMLPVMGAAFKKGIDASGDFTTGPGKKDAKVFVVKAVSVSITKMEKEKKIKVIAEAGGLLTGPGTSGQMFKGQGSAIATMGSKIDQDVKLTVQDAIEALTAKNSKMLIGMRALLKA